MARINFKTETDRSLLEITAQTVNDISAHLEKMNGTLLKHEVRLTKLESRTYYNPIKSPVSMLIDSVGRGGTIAILGSLIAGAIYAFVSAMGWR